MRVIPVLDVRAGRAVWARGGARDRYEPVRSVLAPGAGDAALLAQVFVRELECDELYVADLDALAGEASQASLIRALAGIAPLLLDVGVRRVRDVVAALDAGARRVSVALETLGSWDLLHDAVLAAGAARVVFSLDLRRGVPVVAPGFRVSASAAPVALVEQALAAGIGTILVLDLARVGSGGGLDWALISQIRAAYPKVELFAGGGIGGVEDLSRAARAGCDAVLVATALHDGRLDKAALDAWRAHRAHANDSR